MINHCRWLLKLAVIAGLIYAVAAAGPPPKMSGEDAGGSLNLAYAKLKLEDATVNLRKVELQNKRVRGAVPGNIVGQYREDLEIAKLGLRQAQTDKEKSGFALRLRRARAEAKSAETRWRSAVAATERVSGTFSELDLESLRLQAELARVTVKQGEAVAGGSELAQLRWQLQRMEDQLETLNHEVFRNTVPGTRYRHWRYY